MGETILEHEEVCPAAAMRGWLHWLPNVGYLSSVPSKLGPSLLLSTTFPGYLALTVLT